MTPTIDDDLLEKDELVQYKTLDRFVATFGTRPRRTEQSKFTYIIISIKQGEGHCFIDDEKVKLKAGMLLLINPFTFLHLEQTDYVQGIVMLFTEEFFCRTRSQEQLLYKTAYQLPLLNIYKIDESEIGKQYIQSLLNMFGWEYRLGKDAVLKFDMLHNILLGIMIYLHKLQLERNHAQIDIHEPLAKSQVIMFIQLLNTHFREESSLQFYADAMNITLNQLAQICKKGIGQSPKAIMQEKLLRESKRMLLFEALSIKEIAYDLGFTEPTNFIKFFQQHTGISPKNYKQQNCVKGLEVKEGEV